MFSPIICSGYDKIKQTVRTCGIASEITDTAMGVLDCACKASMPKKKPKHGKQIAYWWNVEIAELRRIAIQCYRKAIKNIGDIPLLKREELEQAVNSLKNRKVGLARSSCWICTTSVWSRATSVSGGKHHSWYS